MRSHDSERIVLRDLHQAIERLASSVDDAPIAGALRRFARRLPSVEVDWSRRVKPRPVRELLYRALDEGALDSRRFDWLMLAESRARRFRLGR
jgi:hypothetical protein